MMRFDGGLMTKAKGAAVLLSMVLCACATSAATENVPAQDMSPLGAYLAARHAQQQHDYGAAAHYIGRTLSADPGNNELVRRAFLLRIGGGDITEAIPLATRIADLDRRSGMADLVLVLQAMKAGHYEEAVTRAEALPKNGVERLAVPILTAWAQLGLGKTAASLATLSAVKPPNAVPELSTFHLALIADRADRIDEAAKNFDKLTRDATHLTWRSVELAGNFFERHQRDAAARRLYEKLRADPENGAVVDAAMSRLENHAIPKRLIVTPQDGAAEALFDLASILNARETLDLALIHARFALYLKPDFPIAQLLLAELEEQLGHHEQALAFYRAIDRASPLSWSGRLREAAMLDELGRTDEAVALLRELAGERPQDRQAVIELGDILRSHDRFGEAVVAYDDAFARIGKNATRDWRLYYSRGIALERSRQWPRAEVDLRHALELEPQQPLVLNYLGYSWVDQGVHLDEALKMVERAVALRPGDGYIVDSLGWAYFRLGNYAKATENLERAIEMVPEDPTINDHLGDAYWRSGRRLEARFQWNRALQFKPEQAEIGKIETKLQHGLGQPQTVTQSKGG
ncbi:MAG: tetratricopeptide repeat protein [Stellaceae bacterium]